MRLLLLTVLLMVNAASRSADTDVPSAYQAVAEAYGIPAALFYAIALTETGRKVSSTDGFRPWPWSANFNGEGHFFSSRRAALQAIETYLADGQRSVDIGLMQVSWRYHAATLGTVWKALDPYFNLTIAAAILVDCQQRLDDWWASVGCYHAPRDPARAAKYRSRVRRHWQSL